MDGRNRYPLENCDLSRWLVVTDQATRLSRRNLKVLRQLLVVPSKYLTSSTDPEDVNLKAMTVVGVR